MAAQAVQSRSSTHTDEVIDSLRQCLQNHSAQVRAGARTRVMGSERSTPESLLAGLFPRHSSDQYARGRTRALWGFAIPGQLMMANDGPIRDGAEHGVVWLSKEKLVGNSS